jgi:chromosome partitioning protein
MQIISCISQKGGVGKSVIARLLARELAAAEYSVRIADLDVQQATSTRWIGTRLENGHKPDIAGAFYKSVGEAIRDAGEATDVLIIDGKPLADAQATEAAKKSDLVVLPSGASVDDLRPTVQLMHALLGAGVPAQRMLVVLVSSMTPSTEYDARAVLENAGIRVAAKSLRKLPSYEVALGQGQAPSEARGRSEIRAEAAAVAEEIFKALQGDQ